MNQRKADEMHLDTDVQDHIGRQLRAGYVDILNQPVPDRFFELLAELDRKQSGVDDGSNDDMRRNGAQ